jgi:hypothetical protein
MRAIVLLSITGKTTRPGWRGKEAQSGASFASTIAQKEKTGRELRPAGRKKINSQSSAWFLDVRRLRAFRSLHNFKFNDVSFLQCAVAVTDDGGIVNEHVRAIVAPDKAISFCVIEPFYGATQAESSLNKCFSFRFAARRRA